MADISSHNGGSVTPGETFNFTNHSTNVCIVSQCSPPLTLSSYPVPAMANGVPGKLSATVMATAAPGDYAVQYNDGPQMGNPHIHVSGHPKP